MKNKRTLFVFGLLVFVLSFLFSAEIKAQVSFSQKTRTFITSHELKTTEFDSISKSIDSYMLWNGSNANILQVLIQMERIANGMNYQAGVADTKYNIARHYVVNFKTAYAMKYLLQALSINEELKDTNRLASVTFQIGVVYYQQKNFLSSRRYFNKAIYYSKQIKLLQKESQCYYLLGIINRELRNYDTANYYFSEGIKLKESLKDTIGLKLSYMEKANMFILQHLPDSALAMVDKSELFSNLKNDYGFLTRKYNIEGHAYLQQNKKELALSAARSCLKQAKLYGRPVSLSDAYQICFQVASVMHDYETAYDFQNKYLLLKDSLYSAEKAEALTREESNFDIKKIENEKNLLAEQNKLRAKLNYSFLGGILLLVLISLLLLNRNRLKQRAHSIIMEQKSLVDRKNIEITQSINYAKRIQNAIRPPNKLIKQSFENSFILYKPKDIVAGDFYWLEATEDVILFAACDCTGHGVPGAMVSVVCHNALNRAVREFGLTQPASILDKTAELVIENFSKGEEDIKDGMDISLCAYHPKTKKLEWAGAYNPLWMIANENNTELIETTADKQPIGEDMHKKPFTNHIFTLKTGDTIYLFTDGYADQFGGPTGQKKLTRKRFKNLLLTLQNHPLEMQGKELDSFITSYRNKEEQIDDILVMGLRV